MNTFLSRLARRAERLGQSSVNMADRAHVYRVETEARLGESWFTEFRGSVGAVLKVAREMAEIDEKLDAEPRLKKIYLEVSERMGTLAEPERHPEPDWVREDPPTEPTHVSEVDPKTAAIRRQGFEKARQHHDEFVRDVSREVRGRPALRKSFCDAMKQRGLNRLLDGPFADV